MMQMFTFMQRTHKKTPLSKISHTYPVLMNLGTVIPYLKKILKTQKLRDTLFEFCWNQHVFTGNQQFFVISEDTGIDCISMLNF